MKNLNVFCDRCRRTITEGRIELRIELRATCGKLRGRIESVDLCEDCSG